MNHQFISCISFHSYGFCICVCTSYQTCIQYTYTGTMNTLFSWLRLHVFVSSYWSDVFYTIHSYTYAGWIDCIFTYFVYTEEPLLLTQFHYPIPHSYPHLEQFWSFLLNTQLGWMNGAMQWLHSNNLCFIPFWAISLTKHSSMTFSSVLKSQIKFLTCLESKTGSGAQLCLTMQTSKRKLR